MIFEGFKYLKNLKNLKKIVSEYTGIILGNTVANKLNAVSEEERMQSQLLSMGATEADSIATETNTKVKGNNIIANSKLGKAFTGLAAKIGISTAALVGVTAVLGVAAYGIYKYVNRFNDMAEKAEEAKSTIDGINDTIKNNRKVVEECADSYEKLAKGVDTSTNKNISLSEDDYEEYLDITNKLAETFPELRKTMDENGNSIIDLGNNSLDASKKLEELLEKEEELNNYKISQNIDDLFGGVVAKAEEFEVASRKLKQAEKGMNSSFMTSDVLQFKLDTNLEGSGEYYNDIVSSINNVISKLQDNGDFELAGILSENLRTSQGSIDPTYNPIFDFYLDMSTLTEEQKQIITDNLNVSSELFSYMITDELDAVIKEKEFSQIAFENSWKDFIPSLIATMKSQNSFKGLDSEFQDFAVELVGNLPAEIANVIEEEYDGKSYAWIKENIVDQLSGVDGADKKQIINSITDLFKFEDGDLNIIPFVQKLQNKFDELGIKIDLTPFISDELDVRERLNNSFVNRDDYEKGADGWSKYYSDRAELYNYTKDFTAQEVEHWLEVTNGIVGATEKINAYENAIKVAESSLSFSSQLSQIQALSKGLDQLDSIMADIVDGKDFDYSSILNNDDFKETFGKYEEEYENFIETVTNSPKDISKCKDAFNELATAYVYGSDALSNLTEESKDAAILELKQMGIANATEIVNNALGRYSEALEVAKQYSFDLEEQSLETLSTLAKEKKIVGEDAEALFYYAMQKQLCSETGFSTAEDCEQLIALAEQAKVTGEIINKLRIAMDILSSDGAVTWGEKTKEYARKAIEDAFAELANLDVKFGGGSKTKEAGEKAADEYVKAFEKELESLQLLRDTGEINEKEYLDRLRVLYEKYFKDRKQYLKEFKKYEKEYLEGMESLYSSALSGITKLLDKRIDAINKEKDAVIDALEEEKEARLEAIESQIDAKQEVIDGIQKEIDKMQEANDERKRQIDLQKAQYDLERLQNQKTRLVYKDGQMVYETDSAGIRDAREEVADAELEIEISKKEKQISLLEEEIELLEKQRESVEDYYDKMIKQQEKYFDSLIKNLEDQKSKWEELAEIKEVAEAYSAIEQVFGDLGYTVEDVLNGSTGAFEDFKAKYISILSDMNQNTSFQDGLAKASGVAKEQFGSIVDTAKEELSKMDQLGIDAGQGFINGWDEKSEEIKKATKQTAEEAVDAYAEGQHSNSPSLDYKEKAYDAIQGLVDGIKEKKQEFIDSVKALAQEGATAFGEEFSSEDNGLKSSFDSLELLIDSISEAIGIGVNATEDGLLGAISSLNNVSLGDDKTGIIGQFNALKTAVDEATSAISGGGSKAVEGGGLATGANGGAATPTSTDASSGGGAGSLKSALKEQVEEAKTIIPEEIALFNGEEESLLSGVNDVIEVLTGGEEATGEGENVDPSTLIGSNQLQYEKATEIIPEEVNLFKELEASIAACVAQLQTMIALLESASSKAGSLNVPVSGGTGLNGNANATGTWGAKSNSKTLTGELGQELVVRGNRFFTVGDTGAEFVDIKKDDIVFNHKQTEELLRNGHITGRGKALAGGNYVPLSSVDSDKFSMFSKLENFSKGLMLGSNNLNYFNDALVGTTNGINSIKNMTNTQEVNISIGDINLSGVQDVNGLANAITTKLPNMLLQKITKR